MHIRSLLLALTASVALASPAFAVFGCKDYTTVTPDTGSNIVLIGAKAGSPRSHGYAGIPGQNGCPVKAAPGTCVDPTKSLSDPELGGSAGKLTDLMNGEVPDIYTHRKTFLGQPFGPHLPGTC